MATFASEAVDEPDKHTRLATKLFQCPKCPRSFKEKVGLRNHLAAHSSSVNDSLPFLAAQVAPPVTVQSRLRITPDLAVRVTLLIGGKSAEERCTEKEAAAAADAARTTRQIEEAERRRQLRESAEAAEAGEHRRGSHLRRQYTCKEKLRILDIFDTINDDPLQLKKVEAFHAHPKARSTPYTTVRTHWLGQTRATRSNLKGCW